MSLGHPLTAAFDGGAAVSTFSADEIMRHYMAALINEGAKVVEETIALRPLDVDVSFLFWYGFPGH